MFSGLTQADSVALWRAAARGHVRDGNLDQALHCWNAARLIEGKPERKRNRR